jgi:type IX secretion system PorP/SprF family membrane protein
VKKIISIAFVLLAYSTSQGQSRKHASNFSMFQQYYNPAFTGFKGSVIKLYYRNQWAGFDGAPKTFFISGEINLADYFKKGVPVAEGDQPVVKAGIQHSVGVSVLSDTFGPFVENHIFASYRYVVILTEKVRLQAGAAIAYHAQTLDGNKLTSEEENDPSLQNYINHTNRSGRMDFNMGIALSGEDFYAGYAMQNIKGGLGESKNDFFKNNSKMHYIVQGGYRRALSDKVGLVFNGLFRFDDQLKETIEGQIKGVFYNTAWLGVGYRNSLAYSLHTGFRISQLQLGYAYEIPTGKAQMTGNGTNEIVVTYDLQKIIYHGLTRKMSIW